MPLFLIITFCHPAYLWYTDKKTYNFLNKSGLIETADFPKLTGTASDEIVLSDLPSGIYYVNGQYRVAPGSEPVYHSNPYAIIIVGNNGNKVRRITDSNFEDYTIENDVIINKSEMLTEAYLIEHHYATEDYVNTQIAVMAQTLEDEITEHVSRMIPAIVSADIDRQVKPITGELEDLETEDKSNLVSAINEAAKSGSEYEVDDNGNLIIS